MTDQFQDVTALKESHTAPGPAVNFDGQMQSDCKALFVKGSEDKDLEVLKRIFDWESTAVDAPEPGTRGFPAPFLDIRVTPDGEVRFVNHNFMATILRSLGIPARFVLTVPLVSA